MKTLLRASSRLLVTTSISCAAGMALAKETWNAADLTDSLEKVYESTRAIEAALPETAPCDIIAVTSEAKSVYSPRNDGAWRVRPEDRPGTDVITLTLKPKVTGNLLRLDFPTDPTLPAQGPGVASNGNSVISEIAIESNGKVMNARVLSSRSQSNEGRVAECAFDGTLAQGWELGGSKPARLVVRLDSPVPAGSALTVRLVAKTQWGAHVPGIVAASVVGGDSLIRADSELRSALTNFGKRSTVLTRRAASPGAVTAYADAAAALPRAELLRSCGVEKVFAVATRRGGHKFLYEFLNDTEWLSSFLLGGVEGTSRCDFAQSLENLRLLHSRFDAVMASDPVLKRLATAASLQAGACNRYRLVEGFELTRKAREDGLLHAAFDKLDVRAMRHAISIGGPAHEFRGWLEETQFTAGEYLGACWAVPYTDPSTYGFSIQAWGFHDPMRHAYPAAKIFRSIGGVCGTLSGFGASSAFTHGVPAFTVGQPAHCAYVVRLGENWGTGNDVSGPSTNSWSAYEGLNFSATDGLLEKTENAASYPQATRLLWVARLQRTQGLPPSVWQASYEQSIRVQPTNFAAWLEYAKALEETSAAMPPEGWLALGKRAAKAFEAHQETAWALTQRCFENGKKRLPTPADRMAALLEIHRMLNQTSVPEMYGYPVGNYLNWQAAWIGDTTVAIEFFGKLLAIHRSENPNLNWVFGNVLGWGNERFGKSPESAAAYAKAMGSFFTSLGAKADQGQMRGTFEGGIRGASTGRDPAAWWTWMNLAAKLLPAPGPGDVHMTPAHAAARPKFDAFPGTLLSATGMLSLSSVSYDKPLTHGQVITGGACGYFDTANETKPWAKVTLAGDGELSGIVLVGRYEFLPEQPWDVPLKVEVSTDDKTWTQVALIEKADLTYRIDLRGKAIRARYVRIERQPGADASAQPGRLHMRNFLVFGKKLY